MDSLWTDIRHAIRMFRANPGLAAVAILSLAVGIGPNSAIFSLVDALGFRPLAVRDARHLVTISIVDDRTDHTALASAGGVSYPEYLDIRAGTRSFSGIAASARQALAVDGGSQPASVAFASLVSADYFDVVGVDPILGRAFLAEDEQANARPAALISERAWRERFDRDPRILERSIRLNHVDVAIVGVVPAAFTGTDSIAILPTDVWIPFGLMRTLAPGGAAEILDSRDQRRASVFARLRDGVSLEQARAEAQATGAHLFERHALTERHPRVEVRYEEAARRRGLSWVMAFSLAVVGIVLLIACANVAGLLLGRSHARRSEVAVRLALGASRWRLVRQLLTESAVLSIAGAALGLLLALWVLRALPGLIPPGPLPFVIDVRLDLRVTAFTLAVGLLAAPIFGLTPALLASRPDITPVLKGEPERRRLAWYRISLRSALVVGQIAVALALVVSSALLVRSYFNTRQIDPGIAVRPMAFAMTAPQAVGYDEARTLDFYARLVERLRATPGVEDVALVRQMPLNALWSTGARKVTVPGFEPPRGRDAYAFRFNAVSPGYFAMMDIRRLQGRAFDAGDRAGAPCVVIVNRTMARRFWPDGSAIGRHITLPVDSMDRTARDCAVVGVVQDSKYVQLTEAAEPYFYLPWAQMPWGDTTVLVRGAEETSLAAILRREVSALDRSVPITQVTVLSAHLDSASIFERLMAMLISAVGGTGLFLSVIGLYGIVSFLVARRTREIGIRIALGARPADVIAAVVGQASRFTLAGCALGLALAVAAGRLMANVLYGVSALDPIAFGGGLALVAGVALAAALVPARRASRIDPNVALRYE